MKRQSTKSNKAPPIPVTGSVAGIVTFSINGKVYHVNPNDETLGPESKLIDFIRDRAGLKGTKWMCREGGCGACLVTVRTRNENDEEDVRAANSCLVPIWSCHNWDISTIEDLGSRKKGYHPIQKRLVQFGGSQCGYCSSGMVMNFYSLACSKKGQMTSKDVEDHFDGNLCRCTGYRPILDAFKSFSIDADPKLIEQADDIEDFFSKHPVANDVNFEPVSSTSSNGSNGMANGETANGCCSNRNGSNGTSNFCRFSCPSGHRSQNFENWPVTNLDMNLPSGRKWIKATNLRTLLDAVDNFSKNNLAYKIVAGNTGTGVFKNDGPFDAFIEVNDVVDLKIQTVNQNEAILGAGTTLTGMIKFLQNLDQNNHAINFGYAKNMAEHIKRVANTPVRNFATIAGNLMLKHGHSEFCSDIFLLLETIGATICIASSSSTNLLNLSPLEFLKVDMRGQVILHIKLPVRDESYVFRSFKIAPRYQNSVAFVNAGFLFKIDTLKNFKIVQKPTICFGGIRPDFMHASKTEQILTGCELGDVDSWQNVMESLDDEIQPDHRLPNASPFYRKSLTISLLYKTILGIVGEKVAKNIKTGGQDLAHFALTRGIQKFDLDTENEMSPLYKSVPKIEGAFQCSGEAEFANDIPRQARELCGIFVTARVANVVLKKLDPSEALRMPGVIQFLTAKDIPGKNLFWSQEELFVSQTVKASGQALGLIIAESMDMAKAAAEMIKIEYGDPPEKRPLILTIKEGLEKAKKENKYEQVFCPIFLKTDDEPSKTSTHVVSGEFQVGGQAHFTMENQVSVAMPGEDGLKIFCATQATNIVQTAVAEGLNIPNNCVNIEVRRLGGGFGGKLSRSIQIAFAAALGAHVTGCPVRVALDLETNMEMLGKRDPYYFEYQVGFDDSGKIDALQIKTIRDTGFFPAEGLDEMAAAMYHLQSCYASSGWLVRPGYICSDTHCNSYCRAPGTSQAIAAIEYIMEHVAHELDMDPLEVRKVNFLKTGDPMLAIKDLRTDTIGYGGDSIFHGTNLVPTLIEQIIKSSDYYQRKQEVDIFNENNRWMKRGLAMVPMRYRQNYFPVRYPSYIAVHHQDGTVSCSHSGVEMGQGINTKVAQVIANAFGIPLSKIIIKPTNNLLSANSNWTGPDITGELVCFATQKSCEIILERMTPLKKLHKNLKWEQLVQQSHNEGLDLRATYQYSHTQMGSEEVKSYDIYGVNLTEVEVDILTGEHKIVRVDLIQDAGKSLSPEIDIGQIEGALVMGLGLWTTEKLVFDPETGRLLTRNTWSYKIPLPKSIPEDLRVTMMHNATNPYGVLRAKATGEPPLCLSVAVLFAIQNAIKSARQDAGNTEWFQLDGPVTPENIVRLSLLDPKLQFVY